LSKREIQIVERSDSSPEQRDSRRARLQQTVQGYADVRRRFGWPEEVLASAVVITGFVAVALVSLSLGHGVIVARLLVAEGVIGGPGVTTAATLLQTIGLRTWHQILMFTLVLSLRILLKKLFVNEKEHLFQNPA
jgi:hypothetical protein